MASSYINNLRLAEMATGDASGTWGTVTNTNLTLIADALGFQSFTVANANEDDLIIPDGTETNNEAISLYVKLTGGNQAATITLGPNTVKKLWIIENSTSHVMTLSQGTGDNVILASGVTKMVYANGTGSGASVVDALVGLEVGTTLYIKNAGTGDDSTAQLFLQTAEADIQANDVLGKINFQAPNEGTGTDAILVAASIQAVSEGNFSSSSNASSIKFTTASSAAAAIGGTDGGEMSLLSNGALLIRDKRTNGAPTLALETGKTDVSDGDVLAGIEMYAPVEASGTDAILVGAAIKAIADADFSSSSNATSLRFQTGASETATTKMTLSSSGRVGIGTTAPDGLLTILTGNSDTVPRLRFQHPSTTDDASIDTFQDANGQILSIGTNSFLANNSAPTKFNTSNEAAIQQFLYEGIITFSTAAANSDLTERMRILSGGQVIIGVVSASTSNQLFVKSTVADRNTLYLESENQTSGHTASFYSNSTQTGNVCRVYKDGAGDASALLVHTDGLFTVAEFNRQSNDGIIIDLKQAGTSEGNIAVSGSTVTYNAFSGSHWARLSDNSKPDLLRGTVIETIDAMCVWYQLEYTIPQVNYTKDDENIPSGKKIGDERYGSQPLVVSYDKPDNVNVGDKINYDHNGTTYEATVTKNGDVKHVQCKVSDTADSTRVYGVFLSWDNDDNSVNDMYVTAVGTNLVRVHKDQTISAGDLLVSNGDGTAKKQDDDIIRSKTIGKALTNLKQKTYDDGSYTIPCALYCG